MDEVTIAWLKSGEYAVIDGLRLRPLENKFVQNFPLAIVRGQATSFYLIDDNNRNWMLKKFPWGHHPGSNFIRRIAGLIPQIPGFQAGYRRRVLSKRDVSTSGFFNDQLPSWIDDTVLMQRVDGVDWAFLADQIRSGMLVLPNDERLALCRSLSEHVSLLERNSISHRGLSSTNILIDGKTLALHLIDWDEMFHPSLSMPYNTPWGTCGYIAPFISRYGIKDPSASWKPNADRFSLAILIAELLTLTADSPLHGDGGIFDQEELDARIGSGLIQTMDLLESNVKGAEVFLKRVLDARDFDECPSPAEWIEFFNRGRKSPTGTSPPLDFYSCFISYNKRDKDFAQRLYSRLRDAGLRVWFAPEDVKGGRKLLEQVDLAIEMHDRLLLVLSDSSLRSNWVRLELRKAIEFERKTGRRKLFPIRLMDYETLLEWSCVEPQTADDLADEVRSYFIPDFSNWKNYDDFEGAFAKLLNDLKADT